MHVRTIAAATILLSAPPSLAAQVDRSPYADARSRDVASLSPSEIEDLRSAAGMGLARPAELNGYPGPRHVLELADSLELSQAQRDEVRAIREAMRDEAIELGERLITAEGNLAALFATGEVSDDALVERVEAVARIRARLRLAHLRAHLATRELLSRHQAHEYDRLRGYADGHEHSEHQGASRYSSSTSSVTTRLSI